jgi:glycosyltransferase involved in cell wall biosynthesis
MDIFLSVVIPTLNSSKEIKELCSSIKLINFNCEIIFVDGQSTDETVKLIQKILPDATIIIESACGIYDAYNKGLAKARGEYVLFLGSDDRINAQINSAFLNLKKINSEFPMIVCQSLVTPGDYITNHKYNEFNLISNNFCHQSIFYNRKIIQKIGYSTEYNVMADWVLNLKIYGSFRSVLFLEYEITTYKSNGYSGKNIDVKWLNNHYFLKFKYLNAINIAKYLVTKKFRWKKNI